MVNPRLLHALEIGSKETVEDANVLSEFATIVLSYVARSGLRVFIRANIRQRTYLNEMVREFDNTTHSMHTFVNAAIVDPSIRHSLATNLIQRA